MDCMVVNSTGAGDSSAKAAVLMKYFFPSNVQVKLQFGEYVSLGKVESVLKTCPIVENVCVYGESTKSYCVAIVCPGKPFYGLSLLGGGSCGSVLVIRCHEQVFNSL